MHLSTSKIFQPLSVHRKQTDTLPLVYLVTMSSENGGSIRMNILPRTLDAATLKLWAASAVMATCERQK